MGSSACSQSLRILTGQLSRISPWRHPTSQQCLNELPKPTVSDWLASTCSRDKKLDHSYCKMCQANYAGFGWFWYDQFVLWLRLWPRSRAKRIRTTFQPKMLIDHLRWSQLFGGLSLHHGTHSLAHTRTSILNFIYFCWMNSYIIIRLISFRLLIELYNIIFSQAFASNMWTLISGRLHTRPAERESELGWFPASDVP